MNPVPCLPLAALSLLAAGPVQDPPTTSPSSKPTSRPADAPTVLKLGDKLPATLQLRDLDGKLHTPASLSGKVVVFTFWSIICPAIVATEPRMIEMVKGWEKKDVVFLAINANAEEIGADASDKRRDAYADIRAHVKEMGVNFPVVPDHGNVVADMLAARTTPHCFVFDQKGDLRYAGALDNDPRGNKPDRESYVAAAVTALLENKEYKNQSSPPYG